MTLQANDVVPKPHFDVMWEVLSVLQRTILRREIYKVSVLYGTIVSDPRFIVIDEKTGDIHNLEIHDFDRTARIEEIWLLQGCMKFGN